MKDQKTEQQTKRLQELHRQKYLANIRLLPDLQQKRAKEYFQVILTFVALIFAVVFAINPTLTTIANLNQQISTAKQVDGELQTKINNLSHLNLQYNSLQSELPNIYAAIPQTEEAQLLLAELQSIAQSHNLSIISVNAQIDPHQSATDVKTLDFSISANGSYTNVRGFLNDNIHFQRIILPISISLNKTSTDSTSNSSDSVNMIFNGNAYYKL